MHPGGYTVEVTSLSPLATEKDIHDFFAFCGKIEHIEIVRAGEYACTAYVTFKNVHSLETAVLLSGATIVDQRVCVTRWGHYDDEFDIWNHSTWKSHNANTSTEHSEPRGYGEAVTMAQDVVKTMLAKGKDAIGQAKSFDESHQVSATAAAKVAELSERFGIADKLFAGYEAAKSVNEKYKIADTTKSAVSATGKTAAAAATAVVNSSYFAKGAVWVSDALSRAAKSAADMGSSTSNSHGVS